MAASHVLSHPALPSPSVSPLPKAIKTKSDLEHAINSLESHSLRGATKPKDLQPLYNSLISLCITNKALREANHLRSHLVHTGYEPDLFLDNQFVNLYSKCGEPAMAQHVFKGMCQRNLVSWNAMIAGYCSNACYIDALNLFGTMVETGVTPDHLTYLSTLRASSSSGDPQSCKQIHAHLIKSAILSSRVDVGNALINAYSKLGRMEEAEAVFESMTNRDEITWNSLIAVNTKNGCSWRAMVLLVEMMQTGLEPTEFTFGSLLGSKDTTIVKELHSQAAKRGLASSIVAGSALLDAYARAGKPREACLVFKSMPERNSITWNSVIAACFGNGLVNEGLQLFLQMGETGVLPDEYTISALLKAAAAQLLAGTRKQLHGQAIKMNLQNNATIGNSLITMYGKNESVSDSQQAFNSISEPDLITWNSMAQAYLQNDRSEQALILFIEMKNSSLEPDEFSFVGALTACASTAQCGTGRQIHCYLIKTGILVDAFVGSALIDMYSKTMAVEEAWKVFDRILCKDLITWNAMIAGLAQNCYLDEVLKLLCLMRKEKLEPDGYTFASVLAVCSNATAIQQGQQIHALILKLAHIFDVVVTNTLITMYSRAGSITEAEKVFSEINDKDITTWTSMIAGYMQNGYSKEALKLFNKMEKSGTTPNGKTFLALLTACSYGGMSDEAMMYLEMMERKYGIKPGFDHYACMVDILGRAGKLKEAEDFIERMPYKPDPLVWKMLLSSCRIHGDLARAKRSMEKILSIEPGDSAAYVLLSNLYAASGDWNGVVEVRELMKKNGVKKEPGKSWIQLANRSHEFTAGDSSHNQTDEIYSKLKDLFKHMKDEGYAPGSGIAKVN